MAKYLLMNKDEPILLFMLYKDEFHEAKVEEIEWMVGIRPIGYHSLRSFLERRQAPKHRKHIEELLNRYECDELDGFLRVTHALSLNDTFWVKEQLSSLAWRGVSLYQNEFNEVIAQAAFDGIMSDTDLSSTSPEFGTDGYYAKCWVRESSDIFLYKSGSMTFELEPLSEFLASQVARLICPNAVDYDLGFYHKKLITKCRLFTSEKVGLAKCSDVIKGERSISDLLNYFRSIGSEDAFRRMCVLDALIINTDRHYGNFGVLFDTENMEIIGISFIYDNNRSLFFDLDTVQLSKPDWFISKAKPRIGSSFIGTAKGVLTDEIRGDLRKMMGFRFQEHPEIKIEQERLDLLSAVVNRQIMTLLEA